MLDEEYERLLVGPCAQGEIATEEIPELPGHAGAAHPNGQASSRDCAVQDPSPAAQGGSEEHIDRETTRYLAAATQIDLSYAETVVNKVMNEPFRALAPTFGVDVAVVARWALAALRRRAKRDRVLAVSLTLLIPAVWWPWALLTLPVLLIGAWLVVSWEAWDQHNTVISKMLRDRFDPESAPEPASQEDKDRISEIEARREGNLIVFRGHSAFVGSGKPLDYKRLLIDVSSKRGPEGDAAGEAIPFSSQDLHAALVKAFNGTGLAHVTAKERLFVNGLHIQGDPILLPRRFEPPPTSVPEQRLTDAALHPAPDARTYVCVEMPGWQGQLVVSLFARAVHTGGCLYIEWTFHVLPPLRRQYLVIDHLYEQSRASQTRRSLRAGLSDVAPALASSPYKVLQNYRRPKLARKRYLKQSDEIRRGYVFNYGAQESIREDACGLQRRHYFLAKDETMYVLLAQQTLLRTVEDFLVEHKVGLGQFEKQATIIFNQTIENYTKTGDISGTGIVVGANSSATVSGPVQSKPSN